MWIKHVETEGAFISFKGMRIITAILFLITDIKSYRGIILLGAIIINGELNLPTQGCSLVKRGPIGEKPLLYSILITVMFVLWGAWIRVVASTVNILNIEMVRKSRIVCDADIKLCGIA